MKSKLNKVDISSSTYKETCTNTKKEFSYTIKRARLLIEILYEEQLQKGSPTGAIFALKNFGWKDRQEIVQREEARDFSEVSDEELDESIERHLDTHLQEYYGVKLADLKKKTVA